MDNQELSDTATPNNISLSKCFGDWSVFNPQVWHSVGEYDGKKSTFSNGKCEYSLKGIGHFACVGQWTVILGQQSKQVSESRLPLSYCEVDQFLPNAIPSGDEGGLVESSKIRPAILNSIALCHAMSQELDCMKQQRNGVSFIREFICKLKKALQVERMFLKLQKNKQSVSLSTGVLRESSMDSTGTASDHANPKHQSTMKKLPKLGKVYAELRSCMKTSDEIYNVWLKQGYSSDMLVEHCAEIRDSCSELQEKMLLHVRWLIEARMNNIAHLVSIHFSNELFSLNEIFGSNENKRFCKLFEVYNDCAIQYRKKFASVDVELFCHSGKQFMFGNIAAPGNSNDTYGNGIAHKWNNLFVNTIFPLSVRYILDLLSGQFLSVIGQQVSFVLSSCNELQLLKNQKHANFSGLNRDAIWADASRIEVRPVHPIRTPNKSSFFRVIKRVAGVNVPDLDMKRASEECGLLSVWFEKQESLVSSFIAGLSGKTKILRRSYNFQDPYLSDDAMSVSSSENVSTTSSFTRHSETKSVTWHDSWNNDALRSLTSHYREFLTNAIPLTHYSSSSSFSQSTKTSVAINDNESQFVKLSRDNSLFRKDVNFILLQAVVSNLGHLDVMADDIHRSLQCSSTNILINAALACSDNFFCCMLGKFSPSFDRNSMQKLPGAQLTIVSQLCIASLHPLMHVMEMYASSENISRNVLPRVEAILVAMFWWIQKKIQEFFASWSLQSLIEVCLNDLREVTNISLDCLRLVESCHNYIESKRNQQSASLQSATVCLQNIDSIITNMQVLSGSAMKKMASEAYNVAYKIVAVSFPPQKSWIQRHIINTEDENSYIQELIETLLKDACSAVRGLDSNTQLAAMTPIVNSVFESCLAFIAKTKCKFTVQGGMQLGYDFSTLINFVTADMSDLSPDVRASLSSLNPVKRAHHIARMLQSSVDYNQSELVDERFLPQREVRSSMSTIPEEYDDNGVYDDKFWLSLRKQVVRRNKSWTSFLPCMEK